MMLKKIIFGASLLIAANYCVGQAGAIDIKPAAIFKKAIDAYGGQAAVAAVKDVQMNGKVNMMGQDLDFVQKNIIPSGFAMSVEMTGMTIMKQVKKDTVYSLVTPQGDVPVSDAAKAEIDAKAAFFEEPYLLAHPAYLLKVTGIDSVEGKAAYVVTVQSPDSSMRTIYYDVASGLRVQDVRESDTPMGKMKITTSFYDYKPFEGVKVPTKLVVDLVQFKQEIIIDSVKINQGLKLSDL